MQPVYVLGFLFSPAFDSVVTILKQKPDWQAGNLNGVGGRVEATDESAHTAMAREFKEETGVDVPAICWRLFCTMHDRGVMIHCFAAHSMDFCKVRTTTAEEVIVVTLQNLKMYTRISNLDWLIPMAINSFDQRFIGTVTYPS